MNIRAVLLMIISSLSAGCAGYNIVENGHGKGYDVYRPEPYLLMKSGNQGPSGEIIWLPNYSKRYRIDTWNFLGKADFQFDIQNGWQLTKIADKSDNSTIPSKLLEIAQEAVKKVPLSGEASLYRILYNEKGEFIGLKHVPVQESD